MRLFLWRREKKQRKLGERFVEGKEGQTWEIRALTLVLIIKNQLEYSPERELKGLKLAFLLVKAGHLRIS